MSKVVGMQPFLTGANITTVATDILVKNFKDIYEQQVTKMAGTIMYGCFEPRSKSNKEYFSFTGITKVDNVYVRLTGVTRGLKAQPDNLTGLYDADPTLAKVHGANKEIILTDTPQVWEDKLSATGSGNQTIGDLFTFVQTPKVSSARTSTDPLQLTNLGEVQTMVNNMGGLKMDKATDNTVSAVHTYSKRQKTNLSNVLQATTPSDDEIPNFKDIVRMYQTYQNPIAIPTPTGQIAGVPMTAPTLVYFDTLTGKWYPLDSSNPLAVSAVDKGVATSTALLANDPITVTTGTRLGGFTGLLSGFTYYADAFGQPTLTVTPYKLGIALNANEISTLSTGTGSNSSTPASATFIAKGVSLANVPLATLVNGVSVNGVSYATNDTILLTAQTTPSENGLYTINASGLPTRVANSTTVGMSTYIPAGSTAGALTTYYLVATDTFSPVSVPTPNYLITGTSGEALTAKDAVYLKSDGKWWKMKANDSTTWGYPRGVASSTVAVNTAVLIQTAGTFGGFAGFTLGGKIYVNNTGVISQTVSNLAIGSAVSATQFIFDNVNLGGGVSGTGLPASSVIAGEAITANDIIYLNSADGRWYKVKEGTATTYTLPRGIAQGTQATIGSQIPNGVVYDGLVSGLASLTAGVDYYANATGQLTTTAGAVKVGRAISATELVLTSQPAGAGATSTGVSSSFVAGENITANEAVCFGNYFVNDGVKVDTVKSGSFMQATGTGLSSGSDTINIGANANRLLLISIKAQNYTSASPASIATVDVDGIPATLVISSNVPNNGSGKTIVNSIYKILAPATGTRTINITGQNLCDYQIWSLHNVEQITGTGATATSPINTLSVAIGGGNDSAFFMASDFSGILGTLTFSGVSGGNKTSLQTSVGTAFGVRGGSGITITTRNAGGLAVLSASGTGGASNNLLTLAVCEVKSFEPSINCVLKASALTTLPLDLRSFIGFASATVAKNGTANITVGGVLNGFTSLQHNVPYYLSDTAGQISTGAGTFPVKVGRSFASDSILVKSDII